MMGAHRLLPRPGGLNFTQERSEGAGVSVGKLVDHLGYVVFYTGSLASRALVAVIALSPLAVAAANARGNVSLGRASAAY